MMPNCVVTVIIGFYFMPLSHLFLIHAEPLGGNNVVSFHQVCKVAAH